MPLGKYKNFDACMMDYMSKGTDMESARKICGKIKSKTEGESKTLIRFSTPILVESYIAEGSTEESLDVVKIKGTAIKARESRNGVTYEIEELGAAFPTLEGTTIGLNHSDDVTDNVGKIDKVYMVGDEVQFEGRAFNTAKHPDIVRSLKLGLMGNVSIEAEIPHGLVEKNGKRYAKNIEFLGMGFVRHGGIPEARATVSEALEKLPYDFDNASEEINDEANNTYTKGESMTNETQAESKESVAKENVQLKELTSLVESLKKEVESLKSIPTTKGDVSSVASESSKTSETKKSQFVFEGKGTTKAIFYPMNPSDFY